ncbi:MAG: hypothetical protein WC538_21955 [Thermoanaerobaculia bacterium]|jgi:hypothetical protein
MASIPGLSDAARVTLEQAEDALTVLQSPDPYSRTPDYEGRRIETIDGGWRLLNWQKFREKRVEGDRQEQVRSAVSRYRSRKLMSGDDPTQAVRAAVLALCPSMRRGVEERKIKEWIELFGGDHWKVCAAFAGVPFHVTQARTPAYLTRLLKASVASGEVDALPAGEHARSFYLYVATRVKLLAKGDEK